MNPALSLLAVGRFPWAANHVILLWSMFHCTGEVLHEQSLKCSGGLCHIYSGVAEMMLFLGEEGHCQGVNHNSVLHTLITIQLIQL